jgi:hypothetical protein
MKLKKSGLDNEVIYARLEKQGIPDELIKSVLMNLNLQQKRDVVAQETPFYYSGLLKAGLGVLAAIISAILFPGIIILPIGLIVTGIIYALISKKKMK